jgi:hypothetical protein
VLRFELVHFFFQLGIALLQLDCGSAARSGKTMAVEKTNVKPIATVFANFMSANLWVTYHD